MNWQTEIENRVSWIKKILEESHSKGVVIGLSGGKDSAIVAALCKLATKNVIGIYIPIKNIDMDREHAVLSAKAIDIKFCEMDLYDEFEAIVSKIEKPQGEELYDLAKANIKPRMRMTALYAVAQQKNCLVAGTGNLSELTMGYFTKWGDGGYDFNPIGDLTATEVFELGYALNVPKEILEKAPSAGLWQGQTDEQEMGITYEKIDKYIRTGEADENDKQKIESYNKRSVHKRGGLKIYPN